jgi:hypothetical protein
MKWKKPVRVRVEYDDGSAAEATGEMARDIVARYEHYATVDATRIPDTYKGMPYLTEIPKAKVPA